MEDDLMRVLTSIVTRCPAPDATRREGRVIGGRLVLTDADDLPGVELRLEPPVWLRPAA
jgi:hypothetical protein